MSVQAGWQVIRHHRDECHRGFGQMLSQVTNDAVGSLKTGEARRSQAARQGDGSASG